MLFCSSTFIGLFPVDWFLLLYSFFGISAKIEKSATIETICYVADRGNFSWETVPYFSSHNLTFIRSLCSTSVAYPLQYTRANNLSANTTIPMLDPFNSRNNSIEVFVNSFFFFSFLFEYHHNVVVSLLNDKKWILKCIYRTIIIFVYNLRCNKIQRFRS